MRKEHTQHNCCNSQDNVGSMIQRAHAHTGMIGMYNVAGVQGMLGL